MHGRLDLSSCRPYRREPHYTLLCDLAGNMQDVAQHGLILLCRIAELGQAVSVLRND